MQTEVERAMVVLLGEEPGAQVQVDFVALEWLHRLCWIAWASCSGAGRATSGAPITDAEQHPEDRPAPGAQSSRFLKSYEDVGAVTPDRHP
jgi:hypothetical protein